MSLEFDSGPLTWVKGEIDHALEQSLAQLAQFSTSPADPSPLRYCLTHMHQVSGALAMVGLDGAHRVSSEIEHCLDGLEKYQIAPSDENIDTLKLTIHALMAYLQELADGADDVPLRLFPQLKALGALQGGQPLLESELFFPDLSVTPPTRPENKLPAEVPPGEPLHALGQRYRKSLLAWLRAPADQAALRQMRDILLDAERAQALPAQKTLWWAAVGLLEALAEGALQPSQTLRHICTRIERHLNQLAQGTARPATRLLRDILYHLTQCGPVSARVVELKQAYALDSYQTPAQQNLAPPDEASRLSSSTTRSLRTLTQELKSAWNAVGSGGSPALQAFCAPCQALREQVASPKLQAWQAAVANIHDCATALAARATPPDALFSVEMATALLMLESAANGKGKALKDALSKLTAHCAAMRALLLGNPESQQPIQSTPSDSLAVLARVSGEIRSNLQRIEQTLDQFFRAPETRPALADTSELFKQIGGAFEMLEQPTAAAVAQGCNQLVTRFSHPAYPQDQREHELVAESMGALEFYLDRLLRGDANAKQRIEALPERLHAALANTRLLDEAAMATADATQPELNAERIVDSALDAELLDVYLTEAREVLAAISENLSLLREQPEAQHALVTLRRAFHTLKGSGRTVGLSAMGDVAWWVEQLLNQLIETRSPLDHEALELIADAAHEFTRWVNQLSTSGMATLMPALWQARAEHLRHRPAAAKAKIAESALDATEAALLDASAAPSGAWVVIGGSLKVGQQLFNLFLEEAYANLETLFKTYAAASQHLPLPLPDPSRAAHTLAGVSRTVGLATLAELAAALESWLEAKTPDLIPLSDEELRLFDQSLITLQDMLLKAANRSLPKPAPWLTGALREAAGMPLRAEALESRLSAQPTALPHREATIQAQPGADTGGERDAAVDQQLLEVFMEESAELMPLLGKQLRAWQDAPESATEAQQSLQRVLHTLKGSARTAGVGALGDALHALETQVIQASALTSPKARDFAGLFKHYDQITDLLASLQPSVPASTTGEPEQFILPQEAGATVEPITVTPMMRVRPEVIDLLVNEAGEVSIARSRIERQMETFKQSLLELTDSVIRLRGQLREAEIEADTQMQSRLSQLQEAHETFDPLEFDRYTRIQELTRMMAESAHDVATIQQGLLYNLNETEAALLEQSRMTKELQQGLMRTRMVPFDHVAERLRRIVRQTSAELNKQAVLELRGGNVEIDRSVLEKISGPLEHLLRNAVAHGLEEPRRRAGRRKPKVGSIALHVRQDGNEILLTLSDDGGGLDFDKIKAKAAGLGMLDSKAETTPTGLMSLIFEAGFSTADTVSQIAGRGVGLDVVRNEITALGGRIEVASETGKGCAFTIYLPLTLAVNQTVLVRVGAEEYLLPAPMVEQVQKLKPDAIATAVQQGHYTWGPHAYPLHHLAPLLGKPAQKIQQPYTPVMMLRSGARRIALIVDEIVGNREIVVKNIGPQLASMSIIAGATVMGDGKVMLVLNPVQMAYREPISMEFSHPAAEAAAPAVQTMPTVMVVDDSLTMRKVITRLLAREGYHAVTAKDGVDALQQLQALTPDAILLDIEMPRMDGFEFTRAVRGDSRLAQIPIIVISSRTADKHRKLAAELGVNLYLGKPYQEDELLGHLRDFIPQ